MTGTTVVRGNASSSNIYQLTLTPSSVAANTTAAQTFTFKGLNASLHFVSVSYTSAAQAGLGIANARVSATDTLEITFINATASPITPTAGGLYNLLVARSEYNPMQTAM